MFYDLIQTTLKPQEERTEKNTDDDLYIQLSESDQLVAFIEATLGALADDIEMGEREYISHKEAYFGMTYFFLQFCGFRIFLANIDEAIAKNKSLKELAHLIVEIVDNVANNAEYLHSDSDLPEHIAKNIIWQILNSNMMQRRYNEPGGVAQWQAADILDEILDTVIATEAEAVKTKFLSKPTQQSTTEMKTLEEPEICREYGGIFNVAEHFISSLFDKSSQIVSHHNAKRKESEIGSRPSIENSKPLVTKRQSIRARLSAKSMQNIDKSTIANPPLIYPQIENFTEKIGKYVINDIINKWKTQSLKEKWAFSIKFLMGQSDACSDFYIYEAVFGLPTPLYPVPQATCSLIFTIEVSRVKPRVCPINVSYKIEGSGYVFVPEEYVFQESWLLNVINAKIRLFSRVQF
ncbi:uncharacterized protein [Atheta coriaria]|uniref:uncharacterized protein n=1 Tax=Dalotia coriaria TaxID=877792 RepID=UPI0031F409D1